MSCYRPFCRMTSLVGFAVAAMVLLTPAQILPARAPLPPAANSGGAKPAAAPPAVPPTTGAAAAGNVTAVGRADPAQPKSLAAKTIEKVKEVAKSAGDIFSRVPCLPPKGGAKSMGSLPHVASKLAAGEPVVIIAF